MMKKIVLGLLLVLMGAPVFVGAQSKTSETNVFKPSSLDMRPKGFLDHLLDPTKFSMSHSYSISLFSMGKQSLSQGLYLNTINYRFSNPLLFQVRVGFLHQPFGGQGQSGNLNGQIFVQRAMLRYKPSEKMSITIDYQAYPSTMYSPYNFWYRK